MSFEPIDAPDFKDSFISLENLLGKSDALVTNKIKSTGSGFLNNIVSELEPIDAIRCFFAILFLARDHKVDLEQVDDDIKITLIQEQKENTT